MRGCLVGVLPYFATISVSQQLLRSLDRLVCIGSRKRLELSIERVFGSYSKPFSLSRLTEACTSSNINSI